MRISMLFFLGKKGNYMNKLRLGLILALVCATTGLQGMKKRKPLPTGEITQDVMAFHMIPSISNNSMAIAGFRAKDPSFTISLSAWKKSLSKDDRERFDSRLKLARKAIQDPDKFQKTKTNKEIVKNALRAAFRDRDLDLLKVIADKYVNWFEDTWKDEETLQLIVMTPFDISIRNKDFSLLDVIAKKYRNYVSMRHIRATFELTRDKEIRKWLKETYPKWTKGLK